MKQEAFRLNHFRKMLGKKVEVFAFDIFYRGRFERLSEKEGFIILMDEDEDKVTLDLERVDSIMPLEVEDSPSEPLS